MFFTEDGAWRVLGDLPENFTMKKAAGMGVRQDSPRSIAEAGGTLFWLSPWGVCAWRGGDPAVISGPLGERYTFQEGTAGSDGVRYYFSARHRSEEDDWGISIPNLYVYDTRKGLWHREDGTEATEFVTDGSEVLWVGRTYEEGGWVYRCWSSRDPSIEHVMVPYTDWPENGEDRFAWTAEFADSTRFYETSDQGSQNTKGLLRLLLRCELWDGSAAEPLLTAWVRYDSAGSWVKAGEIAGNANHEQKKRSFRLPLILRRCDHYRLKLTGRGQARIYSITAEKYAGSEKQNG